MKTAKCERDQRLATLLRDHGYKVQGDVLIQKGIRGFCSDRVFGRCRSLFDAAEQLIPVIAQPDYSERFRQITDPTAH